MNHNLALSPGGNYPDSRNGRRLNARFRLLGLLVGLLIAVCLGVGPLPVPAVAQSSPPRQPGFHPQGVALDRQSLIDMRRRLIELDKLLSLKSLSRAESLLKSLQQHSLLARELVPRQIKLAQLKGEHLLVLDLCHRALVEQPANPGLWRSLTVSLLAASRPDSVRLCLDRFIHTSPNMSSAVVIGVEMLQDAGWHGSAVSLIDSMRVVINQQRFLARSRSISLLRTNRQTDAAREMGQELQINPYNLPLLRQSVLDDVYQPGVHERFLQEVIQLANESENNSALRLLAANLLLVDGRSESASEVVAPLLGQPSQAHLFMNNGLALTRELPLLSDRIQLQGTVDFLLDSFDSLMMSVGVGVQQNRRAAEHLAFVCETALEMRVLGENPWQAAERFSGLLQRVRLVNPRTENLYSAQIKLAAYTRDVLAEPRMAANRLEKMLLDLDLPTEGVALVRLTLGECYLAAGDTARGRVVLTRLGRDPDFRLAGGHAHYHLARLDLAEGHFATAQDRFAVVAIDHPTATYANDALEMGLAIVEEMENHSGGPNILALYAESVYFDLIRRPEEQAAALERFIAQAGSQVDLEEPQHLLERGKFELAELYSSQGKIEEALEQFSKIVRDHPDGRFPATALVRRGGLLADLNRYPAARQELELLLAQYPDYLFTDDVREMLRGWQ